MTTMPARTVQAAWSLGLCIALAATTPLAGAQAQDNAGMGSRVPRPRIGLVLAGGGAKGGAHVGVLKVLEAQRIPIDCIAGTSMGALVGGGYAAGIPAPRLETFIREIDWAATIGQAGERSIQPIEQKRMKDSASEMVELGLREGHVVAPPGLSNTSAIENLLRSYVAKGRLVSNFDELPIPYRAVATDMVTGRMVVLDRGDLATAMRASMAIPGVFAPVSLDEFILSDGGMVRNIPVDVARQTCAEVVIVVNLVEPDVPPGKLTQATQLLARSMDVMLEANENVQLATLTARDIRIDVPMGDIGTADFERVPDTIVLGEAAAQAMASRLVDYAVPDHEYQAWRERVTQRQDVEVRLSRVRLDGLQRVNPDYARTFTTIREGDKVDIEAISDDARRLAALEDFDSVAYRLEGEPTSPTLVWMPEEAALGRDILRPSLGLYGAAGGEFSFVLGLQHARHWLNPRGGQWRNNLQIGYETLIETSLYQPLDIPQRYFVEPQLFAARSVENLFDDGNWIALYRFIDVGAGLDFGLNLGAISQLRLGYVYDARRADPQIGSTQLPKADARDAGLTARISYDSRNAAAFATEGIAAAIEYRFVDDSLGSDRDWQRIEAAVRTALPVRDHMLWLSVAGGTDLGSELPADRLFSLGGTRTLPAYQRGELRVGSYWLVDAMLLWRLKEIVPVKNLAIYGGFGLQAAGLYDRLDEVDDGEVYGLTGYLGGPTPIGTLTIGASGAKDSWGVWLSLGRPIGHGSILEEGLFR